MNNKIYYGLFKIHFKSELQYKAKAISGMTTQLFWGLMYIFLYTTFMTQSNVDGFNLAQMTTYIWLGQAFYTFKYTSVLPNTQDEIIKGNICYKYTRPLSIFNQWYFESVGSRVASGLLRFPIIIIIGLLLPYGWGIILPSSITTFVLFLIALCLGILINTALSMLLIYLVMKTLNVSGATGLVLSLSMLLGGSIIPIPLMPVGVQNFLNFLPFRYMSDLPLQIYANMMSTSQAIFYIVIALFWFAIIMIVSKILIESALKKAVIQGG